MSITVSLLQDGTNSHKETVDKFNIWATKLFSSDGIVPNGSIVDATPDTGDFALQANGTPDMSLDVLAGSALVTGTPTSGVSQRVLVVNSAAIDDGVTIAANTSGSTKYDWIYIKLDPDTMKDPSASADDVATIYTSRSTSSSTDDGTPPTYGLNIAVVTVVNGASSIANTAIADKRVYASIIPSNPYKARAYLSANQTSFPDAATTKINLDTVSYNPGGNFSTDNKRFDVTVDGYYTILARVYFTGSTISAAHCDIYVNGSQSSSGYSLSGQSTGVFSVHTHDILYLQAGDYVELYGYCNVGSGYGTVQSGELLTFMAVSLNSQ